MAGGTYLIWVIICGGICSAIAASKGRTPVGWFFMGLIGVIGIIVTAVMPNENERRRREEHDRSERHRLREQLRQERMKSEAYRRHAAARLDAHDQHLGIDTRGLDPLPAGHGMPRQLAPGSAGPLDGSAGNDAPGGPAAMPLQDAPRVREWFYERNGESRGPVSEAAIRNGLAQGKLDDTTLVWREGMPNWQAVSEVPLFATSFRG